MHKQPKLLFLLCCLYFSQGLPSGLLAHTLPAIMRHYHVSLELIGLLKLLALPWFFKFLWSPYIDQYWQKKYWILGFQSCAIGLLLLLSTFNPEQLFSQQLSLLFTALFLLNLMSASQDIASDGLAASQIDNRSLGIANSIQVGAYKIGLIGGGTVLLILLDHWNWSFTLQCFAGLLGLALIPVFFLPKSPTIYKAGKPRQSFLTLFKNLITQSNMPGWLLIIATYKIADGLGSSMIKPMLIDQQFSLASIGYLSTVSSMVGITGAVISGLLLRYFSLRTCLMAFGLLHAISLGLLGLIPTGIPQTLIYALALLEQFCDGLSTVALFAGMMMHCREGCEGTDYTVQASIQMTGAGIASLASGFIANALGYTSLFAIACLIGIMMLWLIRKAPNICVQAHYPV